MPTPISPLHENLRTPRPKHSSRYPPQAGVRRLYTWLSIFQSERQPVPDNKKPGEIAANHDSPGSERLKIHHWIATTSGRSPGEFSLAKDASFVDVSLQASHHFLPL